MDRRSGNSFVFRFNCNLRPNSPLALNHTYTGKITTSVKDLMGNALQTEYVWSFSTGSVLSPTVIATDPADNATGVFLNKNSYCNLSTPMNPSTINSTTFTLRQGNNTGNRTVSYSGITAYFRPSIALKTNTIYTGTITTGAENVAGTKLVNNYVWTFSTGSIIAPTVIYTDPATMRPAWVLTKINYCIL